MLRNHDEDVIPRCQRLGHEITFGYCRRENSGKPCDLIVECWRGKFDVEGFLQAQLTPKTLEKLHGQGDAAAFTPEDQSR